MRWAFTARTFAVLVLMAAFWAVPSKAMAVPITGGIGFAGGIAPVADWSTVTSIDISGNQAVVLCSAVTPCDGSFAVFNDPDVEVATYNDFTFDPLGGSVTPLWSVDGFSFNLTSINSITRASSGIVLTGTGTLFGPAGLDPTFATWSFSADETNIEFRFSSTTASVPDGGSVITLLGASLLGLAAARRRFLS